MASRLCAVLILVLEIASPANSQTEAESLSKSFRKAARGVLPAVVTVRGLGGVAAARPVPGFAMPGVPYPGRDGIPDSGGSGVVIDAARGYVLTNDHVVPDAPRIVVILPDGRQRTAKEIRRDPRSDLALLIVEPGGLTQAEWGDSEALDLADWVISIGQPFGLPGTISAGIVSGTRRGFGPIGYDDLIQTSAAINPGSSGGPLVDMKGRVVGINVAIKTLSGGYEGVGFAVPALRAKRVASDLAEFGRVRRGYLGVATERRLPEKNGQDSTTDGAIISSIVPGSPADAAGLKPGDVILKVGERPVLTPGSVRMAVEFAPIGEDLAMVIAREGTTMTIQAKPTAIPDEPGSAERPRILGR
ncbi:MAG: trypsin-like serine protease with C-terminal domain [Planctomycetota bacterium]|nr:trypsin-like serine protease with C-terminal domain [Planctomycetota bacterium]